MMSMIDRRYATKEMLLDTGSGIVIGPTPIIIDCQKWAYATPAMA